MIRLLVTAATVSGLLRYVFGQEKLGRGKGRRKALAGESRKRRPARRASRPAAR